MQSPAFKYSLILGFCFFLVNCNTAAPDEFVEHQISLDNHLGTITLVIPQNFDTLISWTRESDFRCGGKLKHGIFDRRYDVIKDTAYMNFDLNPDSLKFIVVSQPEYADCKDDTLEMNEAFLESEMVHHRLINPHKEFSISESLTISGLDFVILASENKVGVMKSLHLSAYTAINDQIIVITCNCYALDCEGFIDQMYNSIQTLRYSPSTNP